MEEIAGKTADALEYWLATGGDTDAVMQKFNTKPATAKKRAAQAAAAAAGEAAPDKAPSETR